MPHVSAVPGIETLSPMLLVERKAFPSSGGWLYEIKFDGYRVLASTGPAARLKSRGGIDASTWFPEVTAVMAALPPGSVLDGEVCVLDDIGRSDFDRLHERARRRGWYEGADAVVYCVFDVLIAQGKDVRREEIEARKGELTWILRNRRQSVLEVTGVEDGQWLYQSALTLQLEGIVGKRLGSPYHDGVRHADWFKLKRPGAVPPERFKR